MHDKARKTLLMTAVGSSVLFAITTQADEPSQWGSGKNLYEKVCGHCHDPAVGVGTIIAGRGLPEPYVKFIVRNGFNGMPAFPESYIDDASIAQVTDYLATLPAASGRP